MNGLDDGVLERGAGSGTRHGLDASRDCDGRASDMHSSVSSEDFFARADFVVKAKRGNGSIREK